MMGFPSRETVEKLRKEYPAGTRVELLRMDDVQAPPIGMHGTVQGVDDAGDLLMTWDSGSSLKVVYGEDAVKKLDAVAITCYGSTEVWDSRDDAAEFYMRAMAGCDPNSHEYQRYEAIFSQIVSGESECRDE